MNRSDALILLGRSRIARLATTTPDGDPHIVPITFGMADDTLLTMVDHKPKTTTRLQRLVNIEAHPRASVLCDYYSEDWSELWWVRVDGRARVHRGDEIWSHAREVLCEKYTQYRDRAPEGPAIAISVEQVSSWKSTP